MELVVRKNDLLRELQLFQGIVERKNTIPILANVLIEANGEEVKFLATDLEVGLRSKCAASVAKGGSLTLPAKKFYEIIKSLPLREKRFGFEPEVTARVARLPNVRIYEVGISYYGRTYAEGKKIGWRDGFRALWAIFKYNFLR